MHSEIISTLIANDQKELNSIINRIKETIDVFQLDIMDGEFVPNPSVNFDFELPDVNKKFEAHLMINNPESWIKLHGSKVDTIIVHIEPIDKPQEIIDQVKALGKKIGFALNPETPLRIIKPFLKQLDQVLIMTVNPGYYGSPFLPEMVAKIKKLREFAPDLVIEADGSINDETIVQLKEAGVNLFCVGSYLMNADDPAYAVNSLKKLLN